MPEIYLDNSATTRPLPEVVSYMDEALIANYGNPSSLHKKGLAAEKILSSSRRAIADRLGVEPGEIYFTSGGTESNNLAIKGSAARYRKRGKHIITTTVEHPSVLESCQALEEYGFEVSYLETDQWGRVSPAQLEKALKPETILVSIIHVNNELGSINDLARLGRLIKEKSRTTLFHVDAVQSFGKILIRPDLWQIDLMTISAHKIHGPKGIGALYIKKGVNLKPLLSGGGQEATLRSGTENMPGIAGFIPAVEALPKLSPETPVAKELAELKNYFLRQLKERLPGVRVNSPEDGAPHIVSLSFPGARGEVLVHGLAGEGVYVSTGSACHSRQEKASHVLRAIDLPRDYLEGTIRISFSHYNTTEELDYALEQLEKQQALFF